MHGAGGDEDGPAAAGEVEGFRIRTAPTWGDVLDGGTRACEGVRGPACQRLRAAAWGAWGSRAGVGREEWGSATMGFPGAC